mmetsp:Transcript_8762/g.22364  ORF Transcript_8762/g.22364 Transcript_8762/m.22364 type:complete len:662 (-) Transcript_8762:306-2291(-)
MAFRKARKLHLIRGCTVLDEEIGQAHRADLQLAVQESSQAQVLENVTAESSNARLLRDNHRLVLLRNLRDQLRVKRLHEARIHNRRRHAVIFLQHVSRCHALVHHRSVREQSDILALTNHPSLANLKHLALTFVVTRDTLRLEVNADARATRVAERARTIVDGCACRNGVQQLRLVAWRHQNDIRQASHVRRVECSDVRRAVGADEPGTVHREAHGQVLQAHVVHNLVVATLQERRVNCAERLETLARQAGGKRHGVLLADADVERSIWERLLEDVHSRSPTHCCVHTNHAAVLTRLGDEALGEELRVARRAARRLLLLARRDVVLRHAVHLVHGRLRRAVSLTLRRDDVNQNRTGALGVLHLLQDRDEVVHVMTVHSPDVVQAELLEQRGSRSRDHAARVLVNLRGHLRHLSGHLLGDRLGHLAELAQRSVRLQASERARQRADGILVAGVVLRWQRHLLIVVEDYDHVRVKESGVVHRLVRHASRDGAVANHGDAVPVIRDTLELVRDCHAKRGGDGSRAVSCAERVVFALAAQRESAQSVRLPNAGHAITSSRQDFVRVTLVSNIVDHLVFRAVEDVVQCDGKLAHAQRGAEVTPRVADVPDHLLSHFLCELRELLNVERLCVHGVVDGIEQRRRRLDERLLLIRLLRRCCCGCRCHG